MTYSVTDTLWVFLAAILVFFMNLGFAAVEAVSYTHLSYGIDRFCAACAEVGVDGLILPDVPYEEKDEFELECRRHRLDLISMVAPTSEARITAIARGAKGFLYVVSSLGVTGMRSAITTDIGAMIKKIRENTSLPCAVGFGISTPEQAWHMAALSDGAIVGSAIVRLMEQYGTEAVSYTHLDVYKRQVPARCVIRPCVSGRSGPNTILAIDPIPMALLSRPVSREALVGDDAGQTVKLLYSSPSAASASTLGV